MKNGRPRNKIQKAGKAFLETMRGESIAPDEVLTDSPTINEKVKLVKYQEMLRKHCLAKIRKARTANDIFADNAMDMAKATVLEAYLAYSSSDRQRAMESVLNRALGKPVDRIMSIAMQVSSKTDMELDHDIKRLLGELGYKDGKGEACPALVGGERKAGTDPFEDVCPESGIEWRPGIPRKIYSVSSED